MSNNLYDILSKLNAVEQAAQPKTEPVKAKTKLAESMETVEGQLSEKYMGFKKVAAAAKAGGADNPEAVAASIGRKKYGKEKFQQAAARGKKLGEGDVAEGRFMSPGYDPEYQPGQGADAYNSEYDEYQGLSSGGVKTDDDMLRLDMLRKKFGKITPQAQQAERGRVANVQQYHKAQAQADDAIADLELDKELARKAAFQKASGSKADGMEEGKYGKMVGGALGAMGGAAVAASKMGQGNPLGLAAIPAGTAIGSSIGDKVGDWAADKLGLKFDDDAEAEVYEKAPPGAKAERMVKHIKKGYAKDGKLTPKEKSIAYATAWKAHKAGKVEEAVAALRVLTDSGMTAEQITEGWDDMLKAVEKKRREEKGTGKFDKKSDPTTGGTVYSRKYNPKTGETDDTENVTAVKRGRGRPKKSAFESFMDKYEAMLEGKSFDQMSDKEQETAAAAAWKNFKRPELDKPNTYDPKAPVLPSDPEGVKEGERPGEVTATKQGDVTSYTSSTGRVSATFPSKGGKPEVKAAPAADKELDEMMRLAGLDEVSRGDYIKQQDAAAERAGKKSFKAFGQDFSTDEVDESTADDAAKVAKWIRFDPETGESSSKIRGLGPGMALDRLNAAGAKEPEYVDSTNEETEVCNECGMYECGCDSGHDEGAEGHTSVSMNMDNDGHQSVSVNADGEDAVKLAQLLKLAGLGHGQEEVYQPVEVEVAEGQMKHWLEDQAEKLSREDFVAMAGEHGMSEQEAGEFWDNMNGDEEVVDEELANAPNEQVMSVQTQIKGGNGDVAGQEKHMSKDGAARFSDNPMAMRENLAREYESIKVKK